MTAIDRDQALEAVGTLPAIAHKFGESWLSRDEVLERIAALPAIPLDDEFIRNLLDVAPCVGAETGFCHAHDQRVKDCEEYFEYQKNRVQNLFKNSGLSLPLLETKKETT